LVVASFLFKKTRVEDPYSFDTDPDPAFWPEYRSGSGPIRIQGFDDQKFKIKLQDQTTIYLSLGLHKGRPRLQLSKENIQHFKI
jgi:hypothetical protein